VTVVQRYRNVVMCHLIADASVSYRSRRKPNAFLIACYEYTVKFPVPK